MHGTDRTVPCIATQRPLGRYGRNCEDKNENDIYNEKGTAAVLPHHVRESPDVTESDGDTDHGQRRRNARAEKFAPTDCHSLLNAAVR